MKIGNWIQVTTILLTSFTANAASQVRSENEILSDFEIKVALTKLSNQDAVSFSESSPCFSTPKDNNK